MDTNANQMSTQIEAKKQALLEGRFASKLNRVLNSEACQAIFSCYPALRNRFYTPVKTVFIFLKQVLDPDKSCQQAVSGVASEQANNGGKQLSINTGPYVKARQRLSEEMIRELVKSVGQEASRDGIPSEWCPYGRKLKAFDGTTLSMPDTDENQLEFPQHGNQETGVGFPIARLLAVISLTTGTVLDYAIDAYKGKGTGETALLRSIFFNSIERDDIVLGDRYFPSFFLMADLIKIGADGVFRGHGQRNYDFRKGQRLGKNDHISLWKKPTRPEWMNQSEYDAYPNLISVREFKVDGAVYVTTFSSPKKYVKKDLVKLYRRRWEIEINLKSIKEIMDMGILTCKTPEMIRKEIGVHFLAYNCIRIVMAEACFKHNALPWKISFKGTIQLLNKFYQYFLNASSEKRKRLYDKMLELIVKNKVGNRPNRVEPRSVKRRRKPYPLLKKPRAVVKQRLQKKLDRRIEKSEMA